MDLAIWNFPPAEFMVSGFTSGRRPSPFQIRRASIPECERWLDEGEVDVALVPTLSILKDPKAYDVVPAVALSTWSYPFARLVLRGGLERKAVRIAYNPVCEQEGFLARLVLKEHYKMEPELVPYPGASQQVLFDAGEDATLVVGADVPFWRSEALWLDLGQEWFELASYPMVWGLFATRKGEVTPDVITAVRDNVRAAEKQRGLWIRAQETSAEMHEFYRDGMRVRLDDLAVASLTEYRQFLFFYHELSEMPEIPFVFLPDEGEEDRGRTPRV